MIKYIFLFVISLLFFFKSFCQENDYNNFFILKAGKGISFGGYGFNLEFRRKHFAYNFITGYSQKFESSTYTIPSSYNVALSSKYYIFNYKSTLRPYLGVHFGWLNNYYHDKIGNDAYDPIVYGGAMLYGIEASEGAVHFSFSFAIDPGFAIVDKYKHPYYDSQFRFSTNIGLGINLYRLPKLNLRKKQDEEIEISENRIVNNNLPIKENQDVCFSKPYNSNIDIPKGNCKDLIIYQQVNSNQFVVVNIKNDISSYNNRLSVYQIDSISDRDISVYILEENELNKIKCEEYSTIINKKNNSIYKAFEGNASIRVVEDESENYSFNISIKLKNLKLEKKSIDKNEQLFYDEILICKIRL